MPRPLEVLICTMEPRLAQAARVLLPPREGVGYLLSCQYDGELPAVPEAFRRADVRVIFLQGRGLSRNRNHALAHAEGDVLLLCDDDELLQAEALAELLHVFAKHPDWHLLQLRFTGTGKTYPADYVSSVELVVRREVAQAVRFDERFGLGSPELACGEEDVFVYEARQRGFALHPYPLTICHIDGATTGNRFLSDPRVQRSKGAVFALTRGRIYAYYKCTCEALGWLFRCGANPLPLLKNLFWGIRYVSA